MESSASLTRRRIHSRFLFLLHRGKRKTKKFRYNDVVSKIIRLRSNTGAWLLLSFLFAFREKRIVFFFFWEVTPLLFVWEEAIFYFNYIIPGHSGARKASLIRSVYLQWSQAGAWRRTSRRGGRWGRRRWIILQVTWYKAWSSLWNDYKSPIHIASTPAVPCFLSFFSLTLCKFSELFSDKAQRLSDFAQTGVPQL